MVCVYVCITLSANKSCRLVDTVLESLNKESNHAKPKKQSHEKVHGVARHLRVPTGCSLIYYRRSDTHSRSLSPPSKVILLRGIEQTGSTASAPLRFDEFFFAIGPTSLESNPLARFSSENRVLPGNFIVRRTIPGSNAARTRKTKGTTQRATSRMNCGRRFSQGDGQVSPGCHHGFEKAFLSNGADSRERSSPRRSLAVTPQPDSQWSCPQATDEQFWHVRSQEREKECVCVCAAFYLLISRLQSDFVTH